MQQEYVLKYKKPKAEVKPLNHIRQDYILKSTKYNRDIIFIPMNKRYWNNGKNRQKFVWDIFKNPKTKCAYPKTKNVNHTDIHYNSGKKVGTNVRLDSKTYWNIFKWIVCDYQKEITDYHLKIVILKRYVNDLQHLPYTDEQLEKQYQRELLIQELKKEIENIEQTRVITITL